MRDVQGRSGRGFLQARWMVSEPPLAAEEAGRARRAVVLLVGDCFWESARPGCSSVHSAPSIWAALQPPAAPLLFLLSPPKRWVLRFYNFQVIVISIYFALIIP